ncbi:mechanosensitive ion channel family protein [candidate division KSB1 bacterium]|nr:mechanosensitive ion channel [candidate division KSB1 bacterium]RQW07339.1 MAG: mechanosensitive ion channel family protein [candidate division KSB1 bacterium]
MNWSEIKDFFQNSSYQVHIGKVLIDVVDVVLFVCIITLAIILAKVVTKILGRRVLSRLPLTESVGRRSKRIIQLIIFFTGLFIALDVVNVNLNILSKPFLPIGETTLSIVHIVTFFIIISLSVYLSKILSNVLMSKGLTQLQIDQGTKYVLKRVTEYALITIGGIIAFQTVGINLSGLAVIFGLLSVGIGFGLQNIASNFISGVILLFERPIQVGDRITVGDTQGDVEEINIRATTIRSLDNISIIVPNTEFVEARVTNWSHGDLKVRMRITVGVSYNSDLDNVLAALREVADESPNILKTPASEVLLMEFGDSSWNMELRLWIADPKDYYRILSETNCAIVRKFRARNIEIPFPQRDVHVRSPLPLPFDSAKN